MRTASMILLSLLVTDWAQAQSYTGTFEGTLNGAQTLLTMQQTGSAIEGEANAVGYRYLLDATVEAEAAQGTLTDPQTGGAVFVELALDADKLTLTLVTSNPNTGLSQLHSFPFQRIEAPEPDPETAEAVPPADSALERDPRLVGVWAYQEVYGGGGPITGAAQLRLYVQADGTLMEDGGQVALSGPGLGGRTDGGAGTNQMEWYTQDDIVYVRAAGTPWVPLARYETDGSSLLLTYPSDGSRQLWSRIQ